MAKTSNLSDMAKFLDRVEKLEEERAGLNEDIKEVFAEAKAAGLNIKALRKIHSLRKLDREQRMMIGEYAAALSVFD